ncbi:NDR1/HIN1-like protein 6 [Malania oleifera]|uniref:NDR1/HIN1-like protein 6 n=1 Tax=Malania oleifera TaxID=397392 RepID=UPI0025ADCA59|nr:NDR1/HIN1-like protein 6 [Malania oleifera]
MASAPTRPSSRIQPVETDLPLAPDEPRRRCSCCCCCHPPFLITAIVFFSISIITVTVAAFLRTREPEFRLDSASVGQVNITSSKLTAVWDLSLSLRNPNNRMAFYNSTRVVVAYRDDFVLAEKHLPAFEQARKSCNSIAVRLAASSQTLSEVAAKGLRADWGHRQVKFNVKLACLVDFRRGTLGFSVRWINVTCDEATMETIGPAGDGWMVGPPRSCRPDFLTE